MKKRLLVLLVTLTMGVVGAQAQGLYFGARGGLNLSEVGRVSGSQIKVGANFGGFVGYQITPIIAAQAELLYSFQGYRVKGYSKSINLDYLKIPLIGKLSLYKGLNVEAGLSFNILTSARTAGMPIVGVNGFDLSIPLGVAYQFGRHAEVGVRYDVSLIPINSVNGTNGLLSLNFAWRF